MILQNPKDPRNGVLSVRIIGVEPNLEWDITCYRYRLIVPYKAMELEDASTIIEIWYTNGVATKFKTLTGRVIELGQT